MIYRICQSFFIVMSNFQHNEVFSKLIGVARKQNTAHVKIAQKHWFIFKGLLR